MLATQKKDQNLLDNYKHKAYTPRVIKRKATMTTKKTKLEDAVSLKAGGINAVTDAKPKKSIVERMAVWVDTHILPYIAITLMVLSTGYTALALIGKIDRLPEQAQGAVALVVVSFITSRAIRKLSK